MKTLYKVKHGRLGDVYILANDISAMFGQKGIKQGQVLDIEKIAVEIDEYGRVAHDDIPLIAIGDTHINSL